MTSLRESLQGSAARAAAVVRSAIAGNAADLTQFDMSVSTELSGLDPRVSRLVGALHVACGAVQAMDEHLRATAAGAPQSLAFRRVDLWGRWTAYRLLLEQYTDAVIARGGSGHEREVSALRREAVELISLAERELSLRGELPRVAGLTAQLLPEFTPVPHELSYLQRAE